MVNISSTDKATFPGLPGKKIYCAVFWVAAFSLVGALPLSRAAGSLESFKAEPDQVLVLYNAEYPKDVDCSTPGQDSREVADYYVERHTDPRTAKKPYALGLSCSHGKKHLNEWFIRETSQDNKDGIVYSGKGKGPPPGEWARDSRHVEIVLRPGKEESIDWDSVQVWCESRETREKKTVVPEITGAPVREGRRYTYPPVEEGKGRCYRFNARTLFPGTVWVGFQARGVEGNLVRDLKLTYYDLDDFSFSVVGEDGVSDEKHFQEDVALPVKRFMEDPTNALPDGTLLKDHILYIVVCHGLPFSCEGVFGLERGVTPRPQDHGDLASLEQRLQTLYYDWGRDIRPPVMSMYMIGGPDSKNGVRNHRVTTAMRYPLAGPRWNPYMHPDTYSFLGSKEPPRFMDLPSLVELRKRYAPPFFSYAVSRVDGQGPMEAKRQIDYAVYASRYLRPEMDAHVRAHAERDLGDKPMDLAPLLEKAERENAWGVDELKCLGFRVLSAHSREGLPFMGRPLEDSESGVSKAFKDEDINYYGYYPGGMDRKVVSGNGWNMGRHAAIWRQVDEGVTLSACGGPAYGGGPHITNATFWDNRILMRYLFRGRDLGECFLRSTYYVNWSTSLLGDPLLHPDLRVTRVDREPPRVLRQEDIEIDLTPALDEYAGTVTVPILSTAFAPEVARMVVRYGKKGEGPCATSRSHIYSARPSAVLRNLQPDSLYEYDIVLTDPYGNSTSLHDVFGSLVFRTGPGQEKERIVNKARKGKKHWQLDLLRLLDIGEKGTISIEFVAGEQGLMPGMESEHLKLANTKWSKGMVRSSLSLGGTEKTWFIKSPLEQGETADMELRWRRYPLTRELVLIASDGTEFTLLADVRTPWEEMNLRGVVSVLEPKGVKVISASIQDDAPPASREACMLRVPPIQRSKWTEADRIKE